MHTGRHSTVQRCFISTNIKHLTFFLELKLDYTLLQKKRGHLYKTVCTQAQLMVLSATATIEVELGIFTI